MSYLRCDNAWPKPRSVDPGRRGRARSSGSRLRSLAGRGEPSSHALQVGGLRWREPKAARMTTLCTSVKRCREAFVIVDGHGVVVAILGPAQFGEREVSPGIHAAVSVRDPASGGEMQPGKASACRLLEETLVSPGQYGERYAPDHRGRDPGELKPRCERGG